MVDTSIDEKAAKSTPPFGSVEICSLDLGWLSSASNPGSFKRCKTGNKRETTKSPNNNGTIIKSIFSLTRWGSDRKWLYSHHSWTKQIKARHGPPIKATTLIGFSLSG